ncbi:hypothetical protein Tco_0179475 [Tanacetum coccineum]
MEECHRMLTDQVDLVNPEGHQLVHNVSKPLPLGGPPDQVTIQSQFFFNKDLEYLVSGDKGRRSALSISKLKEAQYLYFGLEELVSSLWIKSEREYDISVAYGISHWWFKRKEFYIIRPSAPSDRSIVRSHVRILSVVSLKTYERYGYPFLKEIVLRRADYKDYKILETDFKNLHPNNFEDLYLLHLQGQLNHLSGTDKVHLFNALVGEPDEEPAQPEPEPEPELQGEAGHAHVGGVVIRESVAEATRPLLVVKGKGKAIVTEEQAAQSLLALHTPKRRSTTDQFIFQRRTPATEEASTGPSAQPQDDISANVVCESPSPLDAETGAEYDKTNSGGDTEILHITKELGEDVDKKVNLEEKTNELDQDQARSDPGETHESRPLPEQVFMDEDQAGPDPGESGSRKFKFPADEHVILEDPLSSTGTLSSMKNLEDAYTIGDQFINDKSTEDEPEKLNVKRTERVITLEKKFSDLEQKNKNIDNTTRNLRSRVFTLKLRDLPHKIDETVRETIKEAIQVALQAPLRDRFRDLSEEDMKEMLCQRMFESGLYKSLPEHVTLYEALETFMEQAYRDEFLAEKDKSLKR